MSNDACRVLVNRRLPRREVFSQQTARLLNRLAHTMESKSSLLQPSGRNCIPELDSHPNR
eukprot:6173014-Pleurochrysis_carterae.AAC.2